MCGTGFYVVGQGAELGAHNWDGMESVVVDALGETARAKRGYTPLGRSFRFVFYGVPIWIGTLLKISPFSNTRTLS